MNLPKILKDLLEAQKYFDSNLYSSCFSENALVFDEGKIYNGKEEIKHWNEMANKEFRPQLEVLDVYTEDRTIILRINISGSFDGSPIMMKFYFQIEKDKISALIISN
ncbi:hypothetical protein ACM39_09745 [Chryseobacterium sp. FH2]|uniref:nuclear transport factor 2 family protein n=1 Tax=Chryseobacterium sp. FH2 TaxID=1674291 RepID=UPI00065AE2C1|nr:nuclear transport factor 2 family protein [Chryseobacterium sp. FH2]KMQ68126.1 hypothetical protein ACM39_09745 [Chryseobacterium sp. FH2]